MRIDLPPCRYNRDCRYHLDGNCHHPGGVSRCEVNSMLGEIKTELSAQASELEERHQWEKAVGVRISLDIIEKYIPEENNETNT